MHNRPVGWVLNSYIYDFILNRSVCERQKGDGDERLCELWAHSWEFTSHTECSERFNERITQLIMSFILCTLIAFHFPFFFLFLSSLDFAGSHGRKWKSKNSFTSVFVSFLNFCFSSSFRRHIKIHEFMKCVYDYFRWKESHFTVVALLQL